MKKIISVLLAVLIFAAMPVCVYAKETEGNNSSKIEIAQGIYNSEGAKSIITNKTLRLVKSNNSLVINATTAGEDSVTKCGFTYIKLQRLIGGSWTDVSSYCYYDVYNATTSCSFSRTIYPATGYNYRVICEHYAEKPRLIFWTTSETSYNETASLYF